MAAHARSRAKVEKAWPAYADDLSLCRLPQFFWNSTQASPEEWLQEYHTRLQHALSRMNHHIHPLINPEDDPATGERRSLQSCRPKSKKGKKGDGQFCKSGFPLDSEVAEIPWPVGRCRVGLLQVCTVRTNAHSWRSMRRSHLRDRLLWSLASH